MTLDVRVLDAAMLAQTAAQVLVEAAQATDGLWSLVLSGGSTPNAVFGLLAQQPLCDQIPWQRTHVFWGDERHVPANHPDSNYRTACETLLDHVPIPSANVHRVPTELPAAAAAAVYEEELRSFFQSHELPCFDLIMLGLGDDAHTASLFPHTAALHETTRWVVANHVAKLNTDRITLTVPIINNARRVMFLVSGDAKADAVKHVLQGQPDPETWPAQLINPVNGQLIWLLDQAAARQL